MSDTFTLAKRLHDIGAIETLPSEGGSLTADEAADAITSYRCEWAVCCRLSGKVATFEAVFEAVYGRKLDGKALPKRKGAA